MTRQSFTLTESNDDWLKNQISEDGEYTDKSALINDLIQQARRHQAIAEKLKASEQSGFSKFATKEERLAEFKSRLNIK